MWGSIPERELGPIPVMSRVSGKPYFVYVLWSRTGHRFYTGISKDPQRRTDPHNHGVSNWTARYRPWQLVRVERFNTYTDARKRELRVTHTLPCMYAPVDHAVAWKLGRSGGGSQRSPTWRAMSAPPGVPSVFDSLEVKVLHPT